jgi:hypothetical protein
MNDQDMRDALALMIINGMLSRMDPSEIDPANVWYLSDAMIEARKPKEEDGIVAIKKRKKL